MNTTNTAAANTIATNDYNGDYLVYIVDGITVMEEIDELVLDLGGIYF